MEGLAVRSKYEIGKERREGGREGIRDEYFSLLPLPSYPPEAYNFSIIFFFGIRQEEQQQIPGQ